MNKVKYRLNNPRLSPRRTKLEIPGWAGGRAPRASGSHEQVWHCVPFSEGAQYGIELFYPYDNELHVSMKNGHLVPDRLANATSAALRSSGTQAAAG